MAKKKSKKSPKKKKKSYKKQKRQPKEEKNEITEVSKEMYEIQILDLNSKLERLKQQCSDLEAENIQMKENLTQMNEDHDDIISYLKGVLQSKIDDITELSEQVAFLQQAREVEYSEFSQKINTKEHELKKLKERLTTEIDLLNGKLNVLDEFRTQKEELTKKFELQEEAQKLKEQQHQETLRNVEKDFILKNVRMKQEVEERLIKLSEDFQTIMQSKIDSTTRVTIVENNTLKTEMKKLMGTCNGLIKENDLLKKKEKELKINFSLLKEELSINIRKYVCLEKEMQKMIGENFTLKSGANVNINSYLQQIQKLSENLNEHKINIRRQMEINNELKQKLSFKEHENNILNEKLNSALIKIDNIEKTIKKAASVIEIMLKQVQETKDVDRTYRMGFATSLLDILNAAKFCEYEHK